MDALTRISKGADFCGLGMKGSSSEAQRPQPLSSGISAISLS